MNVFFDIVEKGGIASTIHFAISISIPSNKKSCDLLCSEELEWEFYSL